MILTSFNTHLLAAVTVPSVPVSGYANALLGFVASQFVTVLPYAAGVTGFVIGVGMLRRWLGHRNATSFGGGWQWGEFRDDAGVRRSRRTLEPK